MDSEKRPSSAPLSDPYGGFTVECAHCGAILRPPSRKYCSTCAPLASVLWKQNHRKSVRGSRYWLDAFLGRYPDENAALEAYRIACRDHPFGISSHRALIETFRFDLPFRPDCFPEHGDLLWFFGSLFDTDT